MNDKSVSILIGFYILC